MRVEGKNWEQRGKIGSKGEKLGAKLSKGCVMLWGWSPAHHQIEMLPSLWLALGLFLSISPSLLSGVWRTKRLCRAPPFTAPQIPQHGGYFCT